MLKQKISFFWSVVVLAFISTIVFSVATSLYSDIYYSPTLVYFKIPSKEIIEEVEEGYRFIPGPMSMELMKKKGCIVDGILSGYGDKTEAVTKLINRSECLYLHRALETWREPPDFDFALKVMQRIKKDRVIYGMFLAEAIGKKENFDYKDENREFEFNEMCKKGTDNRWGEHTCIPDLERREYQKYLVYTMKKAIDLGIQSFLFGQIYLQENPDLSKSEMPEILSEVRRYAKQKGVGIAIGAQTGYITDENYLKLFDYIEGGVGINDQGFVEDGPCWSRMSTCWGLLWHSNFSSKAKNVILHLDWSGLMYDDMSRFSRMDQETRINTLERLYKKFTKMNMGFMMPFYATINRENGGCYGHKSKYYSPDNKYSCNDEDQINAIMRGESP